MTNLERIKTNLDTIITPFTKKNNWIGSFQILNTVLPYGVLWWLALYSLNISYLLTTVILILMVLFLLRTFVLMHECGHGVLFSSQFANKVVGFFLGVICGMPQYVWSKHHAFHHATNGDWSRYRGALDIMTTEEYAKLSKTERLKYRVMRHILMAPVGGFIYLILNPRLTWALGTINYIVHMIKGKLRSPKKCFKEINKEYKTRYWKTTAEYWHMFGNNVVLLSIWAIMIPLVGVGPFFIIYLTSLSISGGLGILLFTVQHNFENSYAADRERWDYYKGAIEGTSFMVFPRWLNWFTADIAYHHIHHLSTLVPNYNLRKCHKKNEGFFESVKRISLAQVPSALNYNLWDVDKQHLISIDDFEKATS